MQQTYILKGYGSIQPDWVQSCLQLFKSEQINLRKVVLLKNGDPRCFSMLELHFLLPQGQPLHDAHPFLGQLKTSLSRQPWTQQTLLPSPR
jgi:hypothetical protein